MKDKRVDSVVCATDAGREVELIFRLVYEYAGCDKPMERLWISSMEDAAIRDGFARLRPGSDYDALYDAAVLITLVESDREMLRVCPEESNIFLRIFSQERDEKWETYMVTFV